MKNYYLQKLLVVTALFGVILPFAINAEIVDIPEPVNVKTTIFLSGPLAEKQGVPLPAEFRELAFPIADPKICEGLVLILEIQVVRADSTSSVAKPLLKFPLEKGFSEVVAEKFGKKPGASALKEKIQGALSIVYVDKEWSQVGDKTVTLENLAGEAAVSEAKLRFILPAKAGEMSKDTVQKIFAGSDPESIILLENKSEWPKQLLGDLCSGDPEQSRQKARDTTVALIYKPSLESITDVFPEGTDGTKTTPLTPPKQLSSKCSNQYDLNQGIQFISMSKAKPTEALRKADLNNAFQIFDSVVRETNAAKKCCSKALMNRGVTRDLLGETNLALDDLKTAEQCDAQSWEVHYNLACHYSKHKQLDLTLQELTKAVEVGFKDCDQIVNDPDLTNLLRNKDVKGKLRKMLHQHGQYCL